MIWNCEYLIVFLALPRISSNFVKFLWRLLKISTKISRKLIQQVVSYFFKIIFYFLETFHIFFKIYFQFFSKCCPDFLTLLYFSKISPWFSENYCKIFPYSKISPKTLGVRINLCTPVFLYSFSKIFSQLSWNFSQIFQKLHRRFLETSLKLYWIILKIFPQFYQIFLKIAQNFYRNK